MFDHIPDYPMADWQRTRCDRSSARGAAAQQPHGRCGWPALVSAPDRPSIQGVGAPLLTSRAARRAREAPVIVNRTGLARDAAGRPFQRKAINGGSWLGSGTCRSSPYPSGPPHMPGRHPARAAPRRRFIKVTDGLRSEAIFWTSKLTSSPRTSRLCGCSPYLRPAMCCEPIRSPT
jgi:hypothetical protein